MEKITIGYADHVQDKDFNFEYGIVRVTDYTDLSNPVETEYFSCIRLGIVEKTKKSKKK